MREHLYPEQELKALGQRILLDLEPDTTSPSPSVADRVVGVLIALMTQGISSEFDLIEITADVSGADEGYVDLIIKLFSGCEPDRHLWQSSVEWDHYSLLSA